jgi:hypothetical protein
VGDKKGRNICVFDEKGKVYEVTTEYPIVYFTINRNGYLVTIEKTKEGHIISAYNDKKEKIGFQDYITYTQTDGYPLAAAISDDNQMVALSFIDPNGNELFSKLAVFSLSDKGALKVDYIQFGLEYADTIIPQIHYLENNLLVAVADNRIILIDSKGNEIAKQELTNLIQCTSWGIESQDKQMDHFVIAFGKGIPGKEAKKKETIVFYNIEAEETNSFEMNDEITYLYSDDDMTIGGAKRNFYGFNSRNQLVWKYTSLKDVKKIIPLENHKKVALISTDTVDLMEIKK